ncbi:ABC transporter permease [Larkinella arboricola]
MLRTAYQFMKFDKSKSIGIIIGIVISIFLIGQQVGILSFLTGLMGGLVSSSRQDLGEIWVVDNITSNANELAQLDERIVREIRSIDGVQETYAVVVASGSIKFADGKTAIVSLIGSEAPNFVAGPRPDLVMDGKISSLLDEGAVSAEFFDESTFNNSVAPGTSVEINGKSAIIKVRTKNARGFGGSFFYTTLSKARYYGGFPANKISCVAVKVKPGFSKEQVIANIDNTIVGVKAWDSTDLKNTTVRFITITSNIGTSIGSLVVFAIISGFFIIGLTLYSAALDRLKDYGTLKAIGATNGYVTKLILMQSFLFAIMGFVIAMLLLVGFQKGVAGAGLILNFPPIFVLGLFLVTLFISMGGSLFAIRKINSVEPASVFR